MTVKTGKRGRPSGTKSKLTAELIVECAKELMQENAKIPSIRQVSGKLGVDAMAIYHYFSNKAALLEAVTISLMKMIYEPCGDRNWKEELTELCRSYLQLLSQHTGLLDTMLSMSAEGPAEVFISRFNQALSALNLDEQTQKDALGLIVDYLHGYALAMHCNNQKQNLTIEHMDGPLSFYIRALESEINCSVSK